MKFSKTAQIVISCILFFSIFFFTSAADLSVISVIAFHSLLNRKPFLPLFVAAVILFIIDIILSQLDISIRFISDLSVDSYILFLTGIWLYLKSNKEFKEVITKFTAEEKKLFSRNMIPIGILSLIVTSLIFPLVGNYFSLAIGYSFFSYLSRQFNGKIAIGIALIFLALAVLVILVNLNKIAEEFGNFSYFFLVVGTFQEVVIFIRKKNQEQT